MVIKNGKVTSWGSSFIDIGKAKIAPSKPSVTWRSVLPKIEEQLEAKYNDEDVKLEYFVQPNGNVALTHVVQVENNSTGTYYEAFIDAHSGKLVSITDFVSHGTVSCLSCRCFGRG